MTTLLKDHMDKVERLLISQFEISANSGHPVHKGTPRESFIKEFLEKHLSERVGIGTGEIIDAYSQPKAPKNQIDIVLYRRDYPKIEYGGNICGFLAESVIATISIKSTLKKEHIEEAVKTAYTVKTHNRGFFSPAGISTTTSIPKILSYVLAYKGPTKMETVCSWLTCSNELHNISVPPRPKAQLENIHEKNYSLDGIFVLGKGFVHFDADPLPFCFSQFASQFYLPQLRAQFPHSRWILTNRPDGNLLFLFILLTHAIGENLSHWLNPMPYLSGFKPEEFTLNAVEYDQVKKDNPSSTKTTSQTLS